jgi:transposase InsO family protein
VHRRCETGRDAEVPRDEKGVTATAFVQRAIPWFRKHAVDVRGVLTDNGSCDRSHRFRRVLDSSGIRHVYRRLDRPQTNAKAERFIRTARNEWAYARAYRKSARRTLILPGLLSRYDRRHLHRGIGNLTPLSRLEALV